MPGSTPPWKRGSRAREAGHRPFDGPDVTHDAERGTPGQGASLETSGTRGDRPEPAHSATPAARRRAAALYAKVSEKAGNGARQGGSRLRAAVGLLADRIVDIAPRVYVRDLATLRRQFPGLGPEEIADKLVAGAAGATATVGAGIGAAAMLTVPPALPAELAAEITGVAAIELKLIAELHEVYGVRPPGGLTQRASAYLNSWTTEHGIDVTKPSTYSGAVNSNLKRGLRQQVMKRMVRDLPSLTPFMVGAAVGAVMNRWETRHLAGHLRHDLRGMQVPWEALAGLPPLPAPPDALPTGSADPTGSGTAEAEADK